MSTAGSAPTRPLEATRPTAVVVEDDTEVAALLAMIVTQAGFDPVVCDDGPSAIEAVRGHQPLLVTVDVGLPGADGLEVTRRIRRFSQAYVVMISAYTGENDILGGFAAGADDYVAKPFRPRELRSRLVAGVQRAQRPPIPSAIPSAILSAVASPAPPAAPVPPVAPALAPPSAAVAGDGVELHDGWVTFRGLRLSPAQGVLQIDGEVVQLSQHQLDLLELLLHSGERVRTASDLALGLRGEAYIAGSPIRDSDREHVVVAMSSLLARLGDHGGRWIESTREGVYRLRS